MAKKKKYRLKDGVGSHRERSSVFTAGQVLESDKDLCILFPDKFEEAEEDAELSTPASAPQVRVPQDEDLKKGKDDEEEDEAEDTESEDDEDSTDDEEDESGDSSADEEDEEEDEDGEDDEDEDDEELSLADLKSMSVKELKAHAKANGIKVKGLRKKSELIAAITE